MHTNNTRVSLEIVSTGMYSIIITLISRHVIYTRGAYCVIMYGIGAAFRREPMWLEA